MKLGKENSNGKSFNISFFNFNDYGWFQFSSVKHSFETDKSLQSVLDEMGFSNFDLKEKKNLSMMKLMKMLVHKSLMMRWIILMTGD